MSDPLPPALRALQEAGSYRPRPGRWLPLHHPVTIVATLRAVAEELRDIASTYAMLHSGSADIKANTLDDTGALLVRWADTIEKEATP